jgi:nucleotide-binding universal stress UspA family protein
LLLDSARHAELLVVGSRGRGGFAGLLLGSVSQQLAQHATCPVVIVHATDEVIDLAEEG